MAWFINPFVKRESHSQNAVTTYRILVPLSWALVVVAGIYYSFQEPNDVEDGHKIPKQANRHITAFSQSTTVTGLYWILLLLSQLAYVWHLFSKDTALVTAASNVASHFILNNLFVFAWIMLWVRNYLWQAEIILVAHFINQHTCYWRCSGLPAFVHLSAVAGPYAWTLTAIFWNGAVVVDSNSLAARIVANVFIWVIFVVGVGHIIFSQDHLFGYCMSFLTLSLALKQFSIKIISLQWIFAFAIFGAFLALSLYISTTKYYNRDSLFRQIAHPESTDREREPLLNDQA